jgi:hypothetical protein
MDTLPLRLLDEFQSLRVFDLDMQPVVDLKRQALRAIGSMHVKESAYHLVALDLRTVHTSTLLRALTSTSAFEPTLPTLVVVECVLGYLDTAHEVLVALALLPVTLDLLLYEPTIRADTVLGAHLLQVGRSCLPPHAPSSAGRSRRASSCAAASSGATVRVCACVDHFDVANRLTLPSQAMCRPSFAASPLQDGRLISAWT